MSRTWVLIVVFFSLFCVSVASADLVIFIDYSQDTNNFFSTQERRDALSAAANRWGGIINSSLTAVGPGGTVTGTGPGWRIGFTHPATLASFQISTAANAGSDPLGGGANVYGFAGLPANTWILYAGGRAGLPGGAAGLGGTGTGSNFIPTFNDLQGPMHRGVISNTPTNTVNDIPAWGGSITFDSGQNWHFGIGTPAPVGTTDFYSIALHEIGHALGLSVSFNQWTALTNTGASTFSGTNAVAAFNADNGTSNSSLSLQAAGAMPPNLHWLDGQHDSRIFPGASPNFAGTVGAGVLQDLLMEPIANFTGTLRRFEVTNVEVGALRDMGWSVVGIPEASTWAYLIGVVGVVGYGYSRRRTKKTTAENAEERREGKEALVCA